MHHYPHLVVLTLIAAAVPAESQSCASGQTAASPVGAGTLDAGGNAQAGAWFGWTMSSGILGAPGHDVLEDVVIAAIKRDTSGGSASEEGAAYPFRDSGGSLVAHTYAQLVPTNPVPQSALHLGRLGNAIGNPRGANQNNLVLLGAMFRDVDYSLPSPCSLTTKSAAGVVEVYDFAVSGTATSIVPPVSSGACDPGAVSHFGHAIAIGNVDGALADDVVVGAPASDSQKGRVYVLFGNSSFPSSFNWIGIEAPTGTATGEYFGAWVTCEDLDGDGYSDILVCRYERTISTGTVFLYSGAAIASAASNPSLLNTVVAASTLGPTQTISPPVGGTSDGFGWQIYAIGDMGSRLGTCDGKPDIAIWSEYLGTSPSSLRGSLFVYFNSSTTGNPSLNTGGGNVLQLTSPVSSGTLQARYGRGASRVDWKDTQGNSYAGLLVGEPGYKNGSTDGAGRVYLYYSPLGPSTSSSSYQWALDNPNPQADAYFGANIVRLNFTNSYTADEFIVSARQEDHSGPIVEAGRAYMFRSN